MSDPKSTGTRDPIEKVLNEFDGKKDLLDEFCRRTASLIEDLLVDADLRFQSIQARVKKKKKLKEKYLNPDKQYTKLDDITDQAALRIIVYYEDEIDRVAELLEKEFTVLPEFCVDKRKIESDRFGYDALNLVCTHANKRAVDVPFKKFRDLKFEIQITTVLSHAWSEIEHEWYDLKEAYPSSIKRRFSRLAALLEIAESEFLALRNQKKNHERSIDIRVEAGVRDIAIDPVSLTTFISIEPGIDELDSKIAAILGEELRPATIRGAEFKSQAAKLAGFASLAELRQALTDNYAPLVQYVRRCAEEVWFQSGTRAKRGLERGACIYQLSMMLIGSRGKDILIQAMKDLGMLGIDDWVPAQAKIAVEVISKYLQRQNNAEHT